MTLYAKSSKSGEAKELLLTHTTNVITVARRLVENLPFSSEEKERILRDLIPITAYHDL
jgi:hypothetical protein